MQLFDTSKYVTANKVKHKNTKHNKRNNPYNQLSIIIDDITSLLPSQYKQGSEVFSLNGLRVWYNSYGGNYEYNGEYFQEPVYVGYECEIIGTENWDIEQRLKIHTDLLMEYRKSLNIENAMLKIKKDWNL